MHCRFNALQQPMDKIIYHAGSATGLPRRSTLPRLVSCKDMTVAVWWALFMETKDTQHIIFFVWLQLLAVQICRSFWTANDPQSRESVESKSMLFRTTISGELMLRHWRNAIGVGTCNSGFTHSIGGDSIEHPGKSLIIFPSKVFPRVNNEFKGYLPEFAFKSETELRFVEGSLFTVACSDTFIGREINCLCIDGTDKVEGHCQKLYHYTFASFLSTVFDQKGGTIRIYAVLLRPSEFSLSALSVSRALRCHKL